MNKSESFEKLIGIFKRLRDPVTGCPWDIKQTHQSLTEHAIEETYELVDAIKNEPTKIREELGDLLLQVMLHAQIADDNKDFNIYDVIETLSTKLIERHPHVFGDTKVKDAEEVKKNWQQLKSAKNQEGILAGIPKAAPGLIKSELIGKKVASVNFDWNTPEEILIKVREEIAEIETARNNEERAEEIGDLLFTIAQYCRKLGISSEESTQNACKKFTTRFEWIEKQSGDKIWQHSRAEMERLWLEAKKHV